MDGRAMAWFIGSLVAGAAFAAYLYWDITSSMQPAKDAPAGPAMADKSDVQREVDAHLATYDARVSEFLTAVHDKRFADAHAAMAAGYRAAVPLERFERGLANNPWFAGFRDVEIGRTRAQSGSTDAEGTLTWDGGEIRLVAHFVDEGKTPRLMGITIGGSPALPSLAE